MRPPDSSTSENDFAPRVLDVNTQDNAIILRTKPEPKIFTYDNVADADITQVSNWWLLLSKGTIPVCRLVLDPVPALDQKNDIVNV